jgi:peroxiredoxin|tara:strand:+ start:12 stop:536 length:525 start_codon:yes stop_codon:yes gene_type:complete
MKIPEVIFKTRIGDNKSLGGGCSIGGKWKDVSTTDIFKNKKVILFALPGAYTPTCSSQQLPGYEEKYEDLKKFVDEVYCLSVNDSFVMNAWFRDQNITKVKPIGDGDGKFTKGMNMLVDKEDKGFGKRSWRYAMIVNDGIIEKIFEEPGKGNNLENDPYGESSSENVLKFLKSN